MWLHIDICKRGLPHELVNNLDSKRILRKARSMALVAPSIASLRIVLASASKQRQDLLKQIGIEPIIRVSNCDENLSKDLPVDEYVVETARMKAETIAKLMNVKEYDIIIGCDTVVVFDNKIIGKPVDKEDARATLQKLNGNVHEVYTGVTIIDNNQQCEQFVERTVVKFSQIPKAVIDEYVASGEPLGRAGSYGIQASGGIFVENVNGCYYNVVGLPINRLMKVLWKKLGLK
uniref:Maf-like protein n=1 Tax=Setaria digitata TaxID=48799 RepID=A0A915PWE6_9BILA